MPINENINRLSRLRSMTKIPKYNRPFEQYGHAKLKRNLLAILQAEKKTTKDLTRQSIKNRINLRKNAEN